MALHLITGTPGSGKTLYGVYLIKKFLDDNEALVKSGKLDQVRQIYSNIDGLTLEAVLPSPIDWRDTPEGSIVFYDEAQRFKDEKGEYIFARTKSQLSNNPVIKDFEVHRHTGRDVYLITQHSNFIHHHVANLVGLHYHVYRPYGAAMASIMRFNGVCSTICTNPDSASAKAKCEDKRIFQYDKSLFEIYKSATIHTHKFRIPRKLVAIITIFILMVCGVSFAAKIAYHKTMDTAQAKAMRGETDLKSTTTSTQSPGQHSNNSANPEDLKQAESQRVALVISVENSCIAKNSYGEVLPINPEICMKYSDHPSMLSISRMPQPVQEWRQSQSSTDL